MIKCLLTELGRAGRENIWFLVMAYGPSTARSVRGPRCARSVRHDLEPNIFPSGPPTQPISTYYHFIKVTSIGEFVIMLRKGIRRGDRKSSVETLWLSDLLLKNSRI